MASELASPSEQALIRNTALSPNAKPLTEHIMFFSGLIVVRLVLIRKFSTTDVA